MRPVKPRRPCPAVFYGRACIETGTHDTHRTAPVRTGSVVDTVTWTDGPKEQPK